MRPALTLRVLTLDAALDGCSAGIVEHGTVLAVRNGPGGRGQAGTLPALARAVLAEAPGALGLIAVTVGPGSFTGIRAALALGHGIGLGAGVAVAGVSIGAVLRADAALSTGDTRWAAIRARTGILFLDTPDFIRSLPLAELPGLAAPDRLLLAGTAAEEAAAVLGGHIARDWSPTPAAIARAALGGGLPAQPLYIDPARTTRA